jgi:Dna[CI] antecedent, DciA
MERAGRLIARFRNSDALGTPEDLACKVWPVAVGKRIAAHTAAVALVRTKLVVEVEDSIWQRQLYTLRGFILKNLQDALGADTVDDLEFRPMIPRRMPQRAEAPAAESEARRDEADAIADPVLRHIYRASRKKASA